MLSKIHRVQIRDAGLLEVPADARGPMVTANYTSAVDGYSKPVEELTLQMSTLKSAEAAFEMIPPLIRYVQAFEPNPTLKEHLACIDMRVCSHWNIERIDFLEIFHKQILQKSLDELVPKPQGRDLQSFKKTRAQILQYLEPQYRRISAASSGIIDFIEKVRGGMFDAFAVN
ncbi:hypothetical protein G7Y89_g1566 [Cudoniella acicularis]|uniref:Uncharacterized protein n=1 Tax=Cudoniella acicularis TaxID=354080 RepID=A0A8H4W9E8_9HELO|nr:hypothetical protein G7Y89_g1566 [Cudoniella acicularis]